MATCFPQRVRHTAHARLLVACGVLAVALPLGLATRWPQALDHLEGWTVDLRFRFRPPLPVTADPANAPSDQIVVIDYDDAAAQAYGLGRWPWDRRVHAQVLEWLAAGGATVVVMDLVFDRPAGVAEDETLIGAVAQAGMVVLPVVFKPVPEAESRGDVPSNAIRFLWRGRVAGVGDVPGAAGVVWPFPLLLTHAAAIGHIQRTTDADGVLRRVPLLVATREGFLPALSLAAAMRHLEGDPDSLRVERGQTVSFTTKRGQTITLPLDRQGRTWINYAGPWGRRFTHYPYSWLREEIENADGRTHLREWFAGKTVIVTNLTTGSGDLGPTPFERDFPFGEVQAHLVNMILTQHGLRDAETGEHAAITGVPTALLTASALAGGPALLLPAFGVLLLGTLLVAQHAFSAGVVLPVIGPVLALTSALVLLLASRFFIVDRERLRFISILGGLLPPHTIQAIEEHPEQIPHLLGGRRRELTMVFVDMQGFTEFCQKADPLEIQKVLREYRTVVTEALRSHGGTLEKYTGDEVMAFFGDADPDAGSDDEEEVRVARQAANAVRAGLAIQRHMVALNNKWQAQGRAQHLVRVGINTGPVTVGNFGTEQLWQYGVVGTEVNKGKRLEGAAEPGGVLLARRTYALARRRDVLPGDLLATAALLKGFGEETELYALSPKRIAELANEE